MDQPQLQGTKITYKDPFPEEIKTVLNPMLNELAWLLPRWCEELILEFSTDAASADYDLSTLNCEEYRWIKYRVSASWLKGDMDCRRYELIHEFVHAGNGYPGNFVRRIISNYCKEEPTKNFLYDEWGIYVERSTQDLAMCVYSKIYGKLPPLRPPAVKRLDGDLK